MKKRILNKIIAIILSFFVVAVSLPITAFASTSVTVSSWFDFDNAKYNPEVTEIHISGDLTYTFDLITSKTVIIDENSTFTWSVSNGSFTVSNLIVNGTFTVDTNDSVANRLHVYGSVENNAEINVIGDGSCLWHATTTGSGRLVGTNTTYIDYGIMPDEMIPDNCYINLIKDTSLTFKTYATLDESKLIPGNTVTP